MREADGRRGRNVDNVDTGICHLSTNSLARARASCARVRDAICRQCRYAYASKDEKHPPFFLFDRWFEFAPGLRRHCRQMARSRARAREVGRPS